MLFRTKSFALAGLSALAASAAHGATIADVKIASATTGNTSTIDSAVVTFIVPATTTPTAFFVQDATGAMEIYLGATNTTGYTPTVGDAITASGNSYSFKGLYELENYAAGSVTLAVTKTGTAAAPAPATFTTTLLSNAATAAPFQSELGSLSNVTFVSPTGSFAANGTYTVTDGTTTATIFVPTANPLVGTAVPTGAVNISGYLGWYNVPELDPLSITAVTTGTPEPASLGLLGIAGAVALRRRRA